MIRIAAVALVVVVGVGCAGDSDLDPTAPELHELVTCAIGWQSSVGACEKPCGPVHDANYDSRRPALCTGSYADENGGARTAICAEENAFDYHGVTGCCTFDPNKADDGSVYVRFAVCD